MRIAANLLLLAAACGGSSSPATTPTPSAINGCSPSDFAPGTATNGSVTIQYGDPLGLAYSPRCLSIAAGQSVTFFGDTSRGSSFSAHPLRPGGANGGNGGSAGNPIAPQSSGSSYTVAFPAPGTYPYFCLTHEGMGMFGAVQVK